MPVIEILTSNIETNIRQIISLSGVDYELEMRWNSRDGKWYMSLKLDDEYVLAGVKMVADWPLTYYGKDLPLPPDVLMAMDSSGAGEDPGIGDFDERVFLTYFDTSET